MRHTRQQHRCVDHAPQAPHVHRADPSSASLAIIIDAACPPPALPALWLRSLPSGAAACLLWSASPLNSQLELS